MIRFAFAVVFLTFFSFLGCSEQPPPEPACAQGPRLDGVNFGPYTKQDPNAGDIVTRQQIASQLSVVASCVRWVRTFGVTQGLGTVGPLAHQKGLKVALQAWIDGDAGTNREELDTLIQLAKAGHADMLIVGSEVLLRKDLADLAAASQTTETGLLLAYMDEVRQQVVLPVVTAESLEIWRNHPELVAGSDAVLVNYHPFWEGRAITEAVAGFDAWHADAQIVAGGKSLIIAETGWPSAGGNQGAAEASETNAISYLSAFRDWAAQKPVPYFYFSAFDEPWKAKTDEGEVGAHWGVWDPQWLLKPGMEAVIR